MKTIFEILLEDYILKEEDKDKQLRIARAVLEGNACLQKLALLEKFIASNYRAAFHWNEAAAKSPNCGVGRWLGQEQFRFPEAANQSTKKKVSNDRYSWTQAPKAT